MEVTSSSIAGAEGSDTADQSSRYDYTDGTTLDPDQLQARALASLAVTEAEAAGHGQTKDLASRTRVDSAQEAIPQLQSSQRSLEARSRSPLRLYTQVDSMPKASADDTINNSPTLRKHVISRPGGQANVVSASPTQDSKDILPSFRQLTGQLDELAEAAAARSRPSQTSHPQLHHHSHSIGSTTSQSSQLHLPPGSTQTSPSNHYALSARSPTAAADTLILHSPSQYPASAAYYAGRRTSISTDHAMPQPPSLPSASSSNESYGQTSSVGEGYSTSHTTPIEQPLSLSKQSSAEIPMGFTSEPHRALLPPPIGMPASAANAAAVLISAGFRCDYPDCTAAPFQTQYLLSSHKNVHSQNRPHYCPVQDCPRSEGGKGFKRKNEMIRHGLVHNSPGYICPFCPDREHRYPRPDNLQRHVRVHHIDKDRNDPALQEVLAQRTEGFGKARRRRTNGSTGLDEAAAAS